MPAQSLSARTETGDICFLETRIFFKILGYQEGDEIIHVEVETGSDKKIQIVRRKRK